MSRLSPEHEHRLPPRALRRVFFALLFLAPLVLAARTHVLAQNTPLISGGVGFLTATNGGNTVYMPIIEPLLAAPIGPRVLVESRAALLESFAPNGGDQPGYGHTHFAGLTYLEGDFIATRHFTIVG